MLGFQIESIENPSGGDGRCLYGCAIHKTALLLKDDVVGSFMFCHPDCLCRFVLSAIRWRLCGYEAFGASILDELPDVLGEVPEAEESDIEVVSSLEAWRHQHNQEAEQ